MRSSSPDSVMTSSIRRARSSSTRSWSAGSSGVSRMEEPMPSMICPRVTEMTRAAAGSSALCGR